MHRGSISKKKKCIQQKLQEKHRKLKPTGAKSPKPTLWWIRISLDASGTLDWSGYPRIRI